MEAGTNKATDLCLSAIQTIHNIDTRATNLPAAAAVLAKLENEANDPDEALEKTNDDDLVHVPLMDTAQIILWHIPVFSGPIPQQGLWAARSPLQTASRWNVGVPQSTTGPSATNTRPAPGDAPKWHAQD